MRGTITFDHHAQHAWLHFAIRIAIVLLLSFFILVLSGKVVGQTQKAELEQAEILEAEQLLNNLGYWSGPIDGMFDSASRHALTAFQKVDGRKRSGRLTRTELEALRSANRPEPRDKTYAHVEVDLSRQVLMIVDENGVVTRVLPVCTGNEKLYTDRGVTKRAHTPRGRFIVTRKINGLRISSLGALYYPSYIVNGIAIHGSPSVLPYPASHGCIRIPMFAAKELSEMTPVGGVVIVYDNDKE
jgi:peptidoglycan hydrolase-like protein with peptidoglycan-binding domain